MATKEDIQRLETIIRQIEQNLSMKVSQEAAVINAALAQFKKAQAEILAKIAALQAAVDNQDEELPSEVTDALAQLTAAAQAADNIVPDVTDVTDLPPPTFPPPQNLRG